MSLVHISTPSHSSSTPGIQTLPNSILSRIFIIILYSSIRYESTVNLFAIASSKSPLWCLQLVCVRWRKITQNTPTLWSVFELSRHRAVKLSTVLLRVRMCLEYSRCAPLNIRLFPDITTKTPGQAVSTNAADIPVACLEDIARHAHRWHEIKAYTNVFFAMANMDAFNTQVQTHGLPRLRKFTFIARSSSFPLPLPRNHGLLNSASALESLSFHNISFINRDFALDSVKQLHLTSCVIQSALPSLLLLFPHLQDLHWKNVSCTHPLSQPLELPSLHALTINMQDGDVNAPWREIRVPSLRVLVLTDIFEDLSPVIDMIRISKCVVKRLKIGLRSFSSFYDITNNEFAGVTELCVASAGPRDGSVTTQILSQLTWDPTSTSGRSQMLPLLQTLEVQPSSRMPFAEVISALTNLMRSRSFSGDGRIHPVPLVSVKYGPVQYSEYANVSSNISELEGLGKELGIKVEVTSDFMLY